MQHLDYTGLALLISAMGTFVTVVAGTVLSFLNFISSRKRDEHLAEIKTLVNGQSHALNEAVRIGAFAAGQQAAREEENRAAASKIDQNGTP